MKMDVNFIISSLGSRSNMPKMFIAALTQFALLVTVTLTGYSQNGRSAISGHVIDQHRSAVSRASITLRRKSSGIERTTFADDSGAFNFEGVALGEYSLVASADGFTDASQSVSVAAGQHADVEISLEPGAIAESVSVTATRTESLTMETPVPVSIIDREEIEQRPLNTIGDIFRYLPGTSTVNE